MALWSRVAEAANSLTITVSKAWTYNIAMYSGERESHHYSLQLRIFYSIFGVQVHRQERSHALRAP
jgi:hypothetical protein